MEFSAIFPSNFILNDRKFHKNNDFIYTKKKHHYCLSKRLKGKLAIDSFQKNLYHKKGQRYIDTNESITFGMKNAFIFSFSHRQHSRFSFACDNYCTPPRKTTTDQSHSLFSTKSANLSEKPKLFCSNQEKATTTVDDDWKEIEISLVDVQNQRLCDDSKHVETCLVNFDGKRNITAYSIYDELKRFSGVVRLHTMMEIFRAGDSTDRMLLFFGCMRRFCTLVGDPKFGVMIIFKDHLYLPPVRLIENIRCKSFFTDETRLSIDVLNAPSTNGGLKSPRQRVSPANRLGGNRNNASRRRTDLFTMLSAKTIKKKAVTKQKEFPLSSINSNKLVSSIRKSNEINITSKTHRVPLHCLNSGCSKRLYLKNNLVAAKVFSSTIENRLIESNNAIRATIMRTRSENSAWRKRATTNRVGVNRANVTRERTKMFTMISKRKNSSSRY